LVVVALVLVAAALGLGTSKAIAVLSDGGSNTVGSQSPTGGTGTSGSTSGNSGSGTVSVGSDGANTEESGAPVILQGGGAQPGFGAYNAIACGDGSHCVAAGADGAGNGVIGDTSDGGTTWLNEKVPAGTPPLIATTCAAITHCVAVGQGAILTTSNGGTSWKMQAPPTIKTTLLGVACPSATDCLSVGAAVNPTAGAYSGEILRSTDGGSSWTVDPLPTGTLAMADVTCPTPTRCLAVGGGILTSDDGGQSWQVGTVPGGTGVLRSISCSSTLVCVAVGPNPLGADVSSEPAAAIRTTDGGATWSNVAMPAATASIEGVTCAPSGPCYAVGPNPAGSLSAILTTNDDGQSWTPAPLPGGLTSISGLTCPSATTCISVGRSGQSSAVARTVAGVTSVATLPVVAP
jgi:photosystem II stability/assembly factor-like uncharacterized protein